MTPAAGRAHVPAYERRARTLEFLGKQLERIIAEQNSMRDDLRVLTTIVLRLEGTVNGVLDQLHAMVSQHQRFDPRLRRLEEERAP